jgi:post-segregation antitoxin (ccd killing protein)
LTIATTPTHGGAAAPADAHPESTILSCTSVYSLGMRTSVVIDDQLAAEARELGINLSAAARDGLRRAVQRRRAELDREAYRLQPETEDQAWENAEAWGQA